MAKMIQSRCFGFTNDRANYTPLLLPGTDLSGVVGQLHHACADAMPHQVSGRLEDPKE